jgi:hypothetical protein
MGHLLNIIFWSLLNFCFADFFWADRLLERVCFNDPTLLLSLMLSSIAVGETFFIHLL